MSWLSKLFGGGSKNPADAAMPYFNQIPGQTNPYQQPFFEAGKNAIPSLQNQYTSLLNNPGGKLNEIGQNYQQSPGFKFAMEQALGAMGRNQAANGMAGSAQHDQYGMELATNLANQDYNNWLGQATGLYNQGLGGQQDMMHQGQQAGSNMANMIAQALAQQGNLAYQGQAQKNQNNASMWNNILGGVGSLASFTPIGAAGNLGQLAFNKVFGNVGG
jgi:hypothetical protein